MAYDMDIPHATSCNNGEESHSYNIWVWVKIRYPNNWMVNTKLDIHICGPTSVFHFDPHPYNMRQLKPQQFPPGHCAKPSNFRVAPSCLGVDLETFLGEDQQFPSYLSSLAISGSDLLEVPIPHIRPM